ncbi:MAG: FkbM family methyltransferase [Chitinophagaceae bacterium]|nr:FkbM family methyltransferase [Chitinophagaceae bacterium]
MAMLLEYIKNSKFWIRFQRTNLYQKFRNPIGFHNQKKEERFYKSFFLTRKIKLVFDIGANVGDRTTIFSKLADKVIAFEPSRKTYERLEKRFSSSRIIMQNIAVGPSDGEVDFFEVKDMHPYSSASEKHIQTTLINRENYGGDIIKRKVKVSTLDSLIKEFGTPDYIKIDVEGYELDVIKGLTKIISIISIEANLPEFLDETCESIRIIDNLAPGRYKYNIAKAEGFYFEEFIEMTVMLDFLSKTDISYMEIYAKLNT